MHRSGTVVTPLDTRVVDGLMSPKAYEHPVKSVELIETHISWLLLAGDYVYKIKKPIKLDFLNFSRLEQRKFFCDEEIRLNQPYAPEIYLGVVPVTLENGQPRIGGDATAVEYAVRMHRFDQALRLDAQLEQGNLSIADMRELANNIAARHAAAQVIDESQRKTIVARTKDFIWDNITALEGFLGDVDLNLLRSWTKQELEKLEPVLWQRFDNGFVRDCHGDLHLGNLVRLPSGITTFDCIEFNADLRHIDVACDIAFLIMDLVERQRQDLAAHLLNRYLERTGDYGSIKVLSLYFVYRCLVRAKVATILSQERNIDTDTEGDLSEVRSYCEMAKRQIALRVPILIVMCGLSGSGKTRVSGELMAAIPAIRIRSDIERKRMFGLSEQEDSASDLGKGLYTQQASRAVYAHLLRNAQMILDSGHSVILDAAFLSRDDRMAAVRVAQDCGCFPVLLQVSAPHDILRDRIRQRIARTNDASEAGLDVLQQQIESAEPLSPEERKRVIVCDNSGSLDISAIVSRIMSMADIRRNKNARR